MISTEFGIGEQVIFPMAQSGLGCRDDRDLGFNGVIVIARNGLKDDRGRVEAESPQMVGK
jgi:hypothetical protein